MERLDHLILEDDEEEITVEVDEQTGEGTKIIPALCFVRRFLTKVDTRAHNEGHDERDRMSFKGGDDIKRK